MQPFEISSADMVAWQTPFQVSWTTLLLDSYRRLLGRELIERQATPELDSQRLFQAPFVVVSHGAQADPVLCYGNRTALQLWQMDLATLAQTPSRLTAEPVHRDERAQLLARTTRDGYVDDYRGVRISSQGRRFLIEQAIVWNLTDAVGHPVGQAATFSTWKFLDS